MNFKTSILKFIRYILTSEGNKEAVMKFFSRRSSRCCAGAFSATMLLGGGISAYLSILLFEKCEHTVQHLDEMIGDTVTIPSINIVTEIKGHEVPLSLKDVKIELPKSFLDMVHHTDVLPDYCYYISFTALMILTVSIALSLGVYASHSSCISPDKDPDEEDPRTAPLLGLDVV